MQVGDLVRSCQPGFADLIGLIREVHPDESATTVEWLPQSTPLLPMVQKMNNTSLELVK